VISLTPAVKKANRVAYGRTAEILFLLVPLTALGCGSDGTLSSTDATPTGGASGGGSTGITGQGGGSGAIGSGSTAGTSGGNSSGGAPGHDGSGGAEASGGAAATGGSGGVAGTGGDSAGGAVACQGSGPWAPLSVMAVVNPKDHGAVGNGTTDDLAALAATVAALPAAGGIVYLPKDAIFKKTNLLIVTKSHVKFWAPGGQATIFQSILGQKRHQSVICQKNDGCGFFGVKFESDATARFDALEDNQISADHGSLVEVAGCDIAGSAAAGIFLYGSTEHYIEGNYVHHTYADHVHHTDGARTSWVWGNTVFNESPSNGDDGVACVTYGPASPRCGDMEWWKNTILHTEWGRGYSVIGGNDISIHDNWAIGVSGAGIIVASEGSFNSSSSKGISIRNNAVTGCGHNGSHPGILISGLNTAAEPLSDITLTDNVSTANQNGNYRTEGAFTNVTNTGMKTAASDLPTPEPTAADIHLADTTVLRTRDVSHVGASFRPGLHRIHVRQTTSGGGFEERFEYVVKGSEAAVDVLVAARAQAGGCLSERRDVTGTTYARLLSSTPITIPNDVSGVTFRDLRAGDQTGTLSWLWQRVDSGAD
jgi:hypothetical protein